MFRIALNVVNESLAMAWQVFVTNKLRSFLSVLGITIGIYCIILVYTLVHSLERNIKDSFAAIGSDIVFVQKWPWDNMGFDYPWWKYMSRPVVTYQEMEYLRNHPPQSLQAAAFAFAIQGKLVERGQEKADGVDLFCVSHDYQQVQKVDLADGRYFTQQESDAGRPVVILGATIAERLFPEGSPAGKSVQVMKQHCTVVGVLRKEGQSIINSSFDERVILPLNFARAFANTRNESGNPQIMLKAKTQTGIEELIWETNATMRAVRRIRPHQEENFAVNKMSMITDNITSLFSQLNLAGTIIGMFALLVGCFGVANIMFVSVKERTQQIGIQKALGARNYFILSQFLSEAVILCLFGGFLGLALVYLTTMLGNFILQSAMQSSLTLGLNSSDAITGIVVSVAIGLLSGILPALQAARMNPVDAIRAR
ncbi:MAG: hypothetical protein RLZZ370_1085 [Bacteroidota bacterium]|jgi:putative ABC transport system permease protein